MSSTIQSLRDAVVTKVAAHWQPVSPNAVFATYTPDIDTANPVLGRKVLVWFEEWEQADTATRAEDRMSYVIYVWVTEAYTGAESGVLAWADGLVTFTRGLWTLLTNARATIESPLFPSPLHEMVPTDSARTPPVVDRETLDEKKLFSMAFAVEYQRDEVPGV